MRMTIKTENGGTLHQDLDQAAISRIITVLSDALDHTSIVNRIQVFVSDDDEPSERGN
jgi:hypothetical protein